MERRKLVDTIRLRETRIHGIAIGSLDSEIDICFKFSLTNVIKIVSKQKFDKTYLIQDGKL